MEVLPLIVQVSTLTASIAALIISFSTFRRQRTIENQNHLYKYKFEAYDKVLELCYSLLRDARKDIDDFYVKYKSKKMSDEEFNLKTESIESFGEKVELDMYSKSHFFPEEVINCIEDFIDKFFVDHFFPISDEDYNEVIKNLNSVQDVILNMAEVMREDLGIDKLNKTLDARIR